MQNVEWKTTAAAGPAVARSARLPLTSASWVSFVSVQQLLSPEVASPTAKGAPARDVPLEAAANQVVPAAGRQAVLRAQRGDVVGPQQLAGNQVTRRIESTAAGPDVPRLGTNTHLAPSPRAAWMRAAASMRDRSCTPVDDPAASTAWESSELTRWRSYSTPPSATAATMSSALVP